MSNYRFSPSVLDKFQHYLDAEAYAESDYNYTDEGPKQSVEEIRAEREQELIDAINKVPQEPIEAAARGTAFNEIVDMLLEEKRVGRLGTSFKREKSTVISYGETIIQSKCDGFTFDFDRELCKQVAKRVAEGTPQLHAEAPLQVGDDMVLLHGYPDYILPDRVVDLKTTGSYEFGKYERYWQRLVYPYILSETGLLQRCNAFEFLVVEMKTDKKTGITNGEVFVEPYTDTNQEANVEALRWICGCLIKWLEANREKITNKKIFCEV